MADPIRMPDPGTRASGDNTNPPRRRSVVAESIAAAGVDSLAVPEGDSRRSSITVKVRIPPELNDIAERICSSKQWPWYTMSELGRAAYYWFIAHLAEQPGGEGLRSTIGNLRQANAALRQLDFCRDMEQYFESMDRQIRQCIADGDYQPARVHLATVWARYGIKADHSSGIFSVEAFTFGKRYKKRFLELQQQVADAEAAAEAAMAAGSANAAQMAAKGANGDL